MEFSLEKLPNYLHAIAGVVVFFAGLSQILLKKGGKRHRLVGRVYFWTWLVLLLTGAFIGAYFITLIGIFGYYFVLTGYRFARWGNAPPTLFDKMVIGVGILTSVAILVSAIVLYVTKQSGFTIVLAVFGGIFLLNSVNDFNYYVRGKKKTALHQHKMNWYFEHFQRMYISMIAAFTAFCVIQEVLPHDLANWLAPTVIGTILIAWSKRTDLKKFNIEPSNS